jgi:hypothetical protein
MIIARSIFQRIIDLIGQLSDFVVDFFLALIFHAAQLHQFGTEIESGLQSDPLQRHEPPAVLDLVHALIEFAGGLDQLVALFRLAGELVFLFEDDDGDRLCGLAQGLEL